MEKAIFITKKEAKVLKQRFERSERLIWNDASQETEKQNAICVYNVSSRYSSRPFNKLSPFYTHGIAKKGNETPTKIPVPGIDGYFSDSVEGIWQGLKIINRSIDPDQFTGRAKKRRDPSRAYEDTRFKFGETEIGLIEARHKIYVPTYTWMWENCIPDKMKEIFYRRAKLDCVQYFHDLDSNDDINNSHKSYAHASLLVDIINKELENGR